MAEFNYKVTAQKLCVSTLKELKSGHPFIEGIRKDGLDADAFVEWFERVFPKLTQAVSLGMYESGCRRINLNADQMLVTAFCIWNNGQKEKK